MKKIILQQNVILFQAGSFLLIGFIIWIRNLPLVHDAFVEGKQDGMLLYFSIFLVAALLLTGILSGLNRSLNFSKNLFRYVFSVFD